MPASQTRNKRTFHAWHIQFLENEEILPICLISLLYDDERAECHVVRELPCYVWEPYQEQDNIIHTKEQVRLVRELVGTVPLDTAATEEFLQRQVEALMFQAFIGASRLPLTSVEAPLPHYALGQVGYFPSQTAARSEGPNQTGADLIDRLGENPDWLVNVKLFELLLRSATHEQWLDLVPRLISRWNVMSTSRDFLALLRAVVNHVSLSPWTKFAENLLTVLSSLVGAGFLTVDQQIDFLSWNLRQLARHLTAYDLITFHHRGANYPDALFLDLLLRDYFSLIGQNQQLFLHEVDDGQWLARRKQLRRRALRQAWSIRRFYENHAVPDAPTSPGENRRVLPPPFLRVPDEQILNTGKRTKKLYADDPLDRHADAAVCAVLQASLADLQNVEEMLELGMAVFVNRPLGVGKFPGEPDRTMLFSHEAFSRSVALQRLQLLPNQLPEDILFAATESKETLTNLKVTGLPASRYRNAESGVVSLADLSRAREDFLLLRTTRGTIREFLQQYPVTALEREWNLDFLTKQRTALIVPEAASTPAAARTLLVYDAEMNKRIELFLDLSKGYALRDGNEYPAAGLHVIAVHDMDGLSSVE